MVTKNDLINRLLRRAKDEIADGEASVPRDVETVLSFVREHLFDPELNVDRLRINCQLRNHNISTRFKGALGIGIREYIEQKRIGVAQSLLEYRDLEVWRVATSVGFSSAESFCRSFRRRVGTSPSAYRDQVADRPRRARTRSKARGTSVEGEAVVPERRSTDEGPLALDRGRLRDAEASPVSGAGRSALRSLATELPTMKGRRGIGRPGTARG